ncbi:TBC1 domain family member 22A isoform X2 [Phyllostomus hastatus]|nr:TBC1 domain family member 22A isoform X2 [Phyllostomus hastatus]
MAAESLDSEVVMETARRVLRSHSQRQEQLKRQEPPPVPGGDLRLVKSVSESHTACPAEGAGSTVPLQRSQSLPHSPMAAPGGPCDPSTLSSSALSEREASRLDKFRQLLAGPNTDLEELRRLSWSGIPKPVRPITWKLLSGYLPANVDRRPATLQRKQEEYFAFVAHYYDSRNDAAHQHTYRQIHIDIPRMHPEALILQPKVTEIFERILFIWAIRHPASGYVQGINDLVTPFFVVFICEHTEEEDEEVADVSRVPAEVLRNVEADTYWCMSRLLDGIQDNYTFAQPGIQTKVRMLEELVSRIDEQVHRHLEQHEVRYLQFAFRWMNNLLMRELPLRCTVRLWDTYQVSAVPAPHRAPVGHLPVRARGLLPLPPVRLRRIPPAVEEGDPRGRRFPGAAALPAEPAHGPLGRRGRQPAAGRGLPPEVRLRRRPQPLQEMSGGAPRGRPRERPGRAVPPDGVSAWRTSGAARGPAGGADCSLRRQREPEGGPGLPGPFPPRAPLPNDRLPEAPAGGGPSRRGPPWGPGRRARWPPRTRVETRGVCPAA